MILNRYIHVTMKQMFLRYNFPMQLIEKVQLVERKSWANKFCHFLQSFLLLHNKKNGFLHKYCKYNEWEQWGALCHSRFVSTEKESLLNLFFFGCNLRIKAPFLAPWLGNTWFPSCYPGWSSRRKTQLLKCSFFQMFRQLFVLIVTKSPLAIWQIKRK